MSVKPVNFLYLEKIAIFEKVQMKISSLNDFSLEIRTENSRNLYIFPYFLLLFFVQFFPYTILKEKEFHKITSKEYNQNLLLITFFDIEDPSTFFTQNCVHINKKKHTYPCKTNTFFFSHII